MYGGNCQLWLRCLLSLSLLTHTLVEAGHGLWEPRSQVKSELPFPQLHKRWYTIDPVLQSNILWPNGGEISYYYETKEAQKKLEGYLRAGLQIWIQGGLDAGTFKLTQVTKKDDFRKNRDKILLIKYNTNGALSTTPGIPARHTGPNGAPLQSTEDGPTMHLSDRTDIGMLDVAANVAHELGHAWGLQHEHQSPLFWGADAEYNPTSNFFQFNCHNLKDWGSVSAPLNDEDRANVCKFQSAAAEKGFSGAELLPRKGGITPRDGNVEPDWDSIMLYPTGAGGAGPANPDNDQRAHVLLKADGSLIKPNVVPSQRDIDGLKKLYNDFPDQTAPQLINDSGSSRFSKFVDKIKGQKGQKCS